MIEIFEKILTPRQIKTNRQMSECTTFKAGGEAKYYLSPQTTGEMLAVVEACNVHGFPYFILGNGSNVLVRDEGFPGAVISTKKLNEIKLLENGGIFAAAGVLLPKLANFALDNDLTGFEFASGIPGSVGGAIYMNAGAYDGEMSHVTESAEVLEISTGMVSVFDNKELQLGYRTSAIARGRFVVLSAVINLKKGDYIQIKDLMLDLNKRRAEKQPIDMPSAGSAFKRPAGSFAGKLIMEAGLSGYSIGGAQISPKHCGFIVNTGNATASDIISLVEYTQNVVSQKYNITLEREFIII